MGKSIGSGSGRVPVVDQPETAETSTKACPKDDFPLPNMEILTHRQGFEKFSFRDCYSGYNQIRMAPEDAKKTAFRTPKGNFSNYNKVMPFGLKNTGATYQRAMTTIFQDMMHKEIEDYVDDIVVKSGSGGESHCSTGSGLREVSSK